MACVCMLPLVRASGAAASLAALRMRLIHVNSGWKNRQSFAGDFGGASDADLAQSREGSQMGKTRVGDTRAFPELQALERWHAPENFQAEVSDLCCARVVGFQVG